MKPVLNIQLPIVNLTFKSVDEIVTCYILEPLWQSFAWFHLSLQILSKRNLNFLWLFSWSLYQRALDSSAWKATSKKFDLKFFHVFSKNGHRLLISTVIIIKGGQALSWTQGDKTCNFCHCDILIKTRSRMTTAIIFSHQNDAGSHASNQSIPFFKCHQLT